MVTTLVLADDHPIILEGLEQLFRRDKDFQVLATCTTGDAAIAAVRTHRPDVIVLDVKMPNGDGLSVLKRIHDEHLPTRVILLTAAAEREQIVEALQLGARGVVLKDCGTEILMRSIRSVLAGEYWVGREPVSNLMQYLRGLMDSSTKISRQKRFGLTPRELDIVSAVVAGFANKEIAEHFKISEDTVKHHLSNIFDKTGVSTRLELALFAVNQALPFKPLN